MKGERFIKPVLLRLNALEKAYSYAVMRLLVSAFGARAAIIWLLYTPLCYRSASRAMWLHDYLWQHCSEKAAETLVLRCLTFRPKAHDYRLLLVDATGAKVHHPAIWQALPQIVAAAEGIQRRVALALALIECGEVTRATEVMDSFTTGTLPNVFDALVPRPLGQELFKQGATQMPSDWNLPVCKHRLLVYHSALKPGIIAFLARGAQKLTVLQYGELYGLLDLEEIQALLPGVQVDIEYARTRTERFHSRYHELHRATEKAAGMLTKAFIEGNPWAVEITNDKEGLARDMTLDLSDRFFFRALQYEAVALAVEDNKFDDVVIIFSGSPQLPLLCGTKPTWLNDPRIRACCWSPNARTLSRFGKQMGNISHAIATAKPFSSLAADTTKKYAPITQVPAAIGRYLDLVKFLPRLNKKPDHAEKKASVALVTHPARAYSYNAVQMAAHLNQRFNTDIIWLTSNTDMFDEHIDKLTSTQDGNAVPPSVPGLVALPTPFPPSLVIAGIKDATQSFLQEPLEEIVGLWRKSPVVACTVESFASRELIHRMVHIVARAVNIRNLLEHSKYDVVAICPARTPPCAQFASVARAMAIPSLTIEPHCLNASYCRYGSVSTDYAALYSNYFIEEYARNFGIPAARSMAFGSPRILRPQGYEPITARKVARQRLGYSAEDPPIILVPTQPMPAGHALALWRMILRAARLLERPVRVILKAHPEEGPVHLDRYQRIIEEEAMTNDAAIAIGDIKDFIMASELVLTAYSVTAMESVVLERNTAIVSQPGVEYPMAYDEIIGLPLCTTEQETAKAMRDALEQGPDAPSAGRAFRQANPHLFDNSCFDQLQGIVDSVIERGREGIRPAAELSPSVFVTAPFKEYMV